MYSRSNMKGCATIFVNLPSRRNKAIKQKGTVLVKVAGWRVFCGLGHLCGGENFWGRVEKSKIFTFFGEIQLLHFKISKIVAVWPRIVVVFLVKIFGAAFGGLWLQKWRFLIWNSWQHCLQFTASSSAIAFSKIRVVWHFRLKSTLYSGKRPVSAEITDTVLRVIKTVLLGAHWCYFQSQVAPWKFFVLLYKMVKKVFIWKNIEKNPEKIKNYIYFLKNLATPKNLCIKMQ